MNAHSLCDAVAIYCKTTRHGQRTPIGLSYLNCSAVEAMCSPECFSGLDLLWSLVIGLFLVPFHQFSVLRTNRATYQRQWCVVFHTVFPRPENPVNPDVCHCSPENSGFWVWKIEWCVVLKCVNRAHCVFNAVYCLSEQDKIDDYFTFFTSCGRWQTVWLWVSDSSNTDSTVGQESLDWLKLHFSKKSRLLYTSSLWQHKPKALFAKLGFQKPWFSFNCKHFLRLCMLKVLLFLKEIQRQKSDSLYNEHIVNAGCWLMSEIMPHTSDAI